MRAYAIPEADGLYFRLWRLGQRVSIPIMLSQNVDPRVLFFSTVVPATSVFALHHLYLEPRRRQRTLK